MIFFSRIKIWFFFWWAIFLKVLNFFYRFIRFWWLVRRQGYVGIKIPVNDGFVSKVSGMNGGVRGKVEVQWWGITLFRHNKVLGLWMHAMIVLAKSDRTGWFEPELVLFDFSFRDIYIYLIWSKPIKPNRFWWYKYFELKNCGWWDSSLVHGQWGRASLPLGHAICCLIIRQ